MKKNLKWWQHNYDKDDNGAKRLSNLYAGTLTNFIKYLPLATLLFYCVCAYQSPEDPAVPEFLRTFIYKIK